MKSLEVSSAIDNHLKPIQIEGASSPIEISNLDTRINTNLQIAGDTNVSGEAVFSKAVEIEDSLRIRGTENYIYATEAMSLKFHESGSVDFMQFYGQRLLVDGNGYEALGGASGSTGVTVWSPDGYDSFVALYEHLGLKWTIGQDSDDSNNLKFDYGAATGGATKLTLDGSGNLTASNSVVVGNATLTTSELDCSSGDFTVDVAGDVVFDADGGQVTIKDGGASHFLFDCDNTKMVIYDDTDAADLFSITVAASGASKIATVDDGAAIGHLTLDVDGHIILDSQTGITKFYKAGETDDICKLTVAANGVTTITTNDTSSLNGINGHFTIDADGYIGLDSATGAVYCYDAGSFNGGLEETFGGGFNFTIQAAAGLAQNRLYLGCTSSGVGQIKTNNLFGTSAAAHIVIDSGGHVEFDDCGVGFDLVTPTYNAADTDVDFRTGNKQFVTFGSGNIADLNLKFPATSGNFTLLLKQDGTGSRTVAADGWLAFDSAGNAANGSSTVKFAGGSNPTLTTDANHVDIISFFWDADNEIAYGVASLDFQF